LPTRSLVQVPVVADEHRTTERVEIHDDAVVEPNAASQGLEVTSTGNNGSEPAPVTGSPPARLRELEALAADRFGVHFTADAELKELLERARGLASHRLPKNDLSSLMRLVLASFVKHEEARRFAVGRKPRRAKADATHAKASSPRATSPGGAGAAIASPGSKDALGPQASRVERVAEGFARRRKRSRYVSAAVRREVYLRDRGQCSFESEDGRRCEARAMLELDHVEPWAKLGDASVDNIRLRCRAHNQMHARECFGARHVEAKIAARRCAAVPMR
jgi:hypothetical protein